MHNAPQPGRSLFVRRAWLVWAAAILIASVAPEAWVFGLTPEDAWSAEGALGHFVEFGLFAVLVAEARRAQASGSDGLFAGAVAGIFYGVVIELVQAPLPYRDCSPLDLAVDAAGVAVALGVLSVVRRRAGAPGRRAR